MSEPTLAGPSVRRVVAGTGAGGRSRVISDAPSPHRKRASDSIDFVELWVTPSSPPEPGEELRDSAAGAPDGLEPEDPRGTLLRVTTFHPDPPDVDLGELMHATKTVDYVWVIAGEIVCVLDDDEVVLRPGEVLIQRGNRHAWSNRTQSDAVVGFVQVGAPDHGGPGDPGWTPET